jgi:hypothetical protein
MPKWIHDRAKHILAKNPGMPESEAFAIATQQSHATGHSPKGYGTAEGRREAKRKYDTPEDDEQRANPKEAAMNTLATRMKTHFASMKLAATTTSDVETKGSLEQNVDTPQKGTNHTRLGAGEQKGVPTEGYLWGQEPPATNPSIGNRNPASEALSLDGEAIHRESTHDLLHRLFDQMPAASEAAKRTVEQQFTHGHRGTYTTHSQTLLEKVRKVTGRD